MSRPISVSAAALAGFLLLEAGPAAAVTLEQAIGLHSAGRLEEALAAYRELSGSKDPYEASTALGNACVILMDRGEYRAALADCRESLQLARAADDPLAVAEALNNLGLLQEVSGETVEAERSFREALSIHRRERSAEGEAINLSNLGTLLFSTGRYSPALALHREAELLAGRHRGEPWAAEQAQVARINRGVVLEKVGAPREALDLYQEILAGSEAVDPRRRAALRVNVGVIYRNLGDPVSAAGAFRAAIASYERLGGRDIAALSNAHLNLGLALHLNLERPAEAERAFREALRLAEASGDRTEEIQDLFYLGRLLLERRRLDEAEASFRRCLAVSATSGSAEGRWSAHEGLGRVARARGDLRRALAELDQALGEIEAVRAGLEQGRRRAGYFGDKRAVYAAAVEVLGALEGREADRGRRGGYAERAFEVAQRAKARDLLDALGTERALSFASTALRNEVGGGTVLEYFLGESRLYLWVVRRGSLRMLDLGPSAPVLAAAGEVHRALAHGQEPSPAALAALSAALLRPAGRIFPRDSSPLWIAPDGRLHYVPFELLETAPGVPLVERAAVRYLPSAAVLPWLERARSDEPALRLAGFGDPRPPRNGAGSLSPRDLLVARFGLGPLPASVRELEGLRRTLGGDAELFTGDRATERSFRQAAARGARVVHLATHTVIDERPGRGAAILLTPEGEDDGLLFPEEIARLSDRSGLTVLAACRTALGAAEDGQALSSLTGSFLAAGSPAVIATLWDVGDAATAVFMDRLYRELAEGYEPAEALRRAKLRFREDPRWSRPALWAGYVLVGEGTRIAPRWPLRSLAAAGLAILGGVLALAAVWRAASIRRRARPPHRPEAGAGPGG